MEESTNPEENKIEELGSEKSARENEIKSKKMIKIEKDTLHRLKTDPDIQAFFSAYKPNYVESFIKEYAHTKSMVIEYAPLYKRIREEQFEKYINRAKNCLKEIQLKKLYDVSKLWNANLLQLEGIDISENFNYHSSHIMTCPFIGPIEQEEVDLYIKYLQSDNFDPDAIHYSLYTIEHFIEIDNDSSEDLPEWFQFHNLYTDAGKYLLLPNYRTEKQDFYRKLYYQKEKNEKEIKGEVTTEPIADNRLDINAYRYKDMMTFVKKFENPEFQNQFRDYSLGSNNNFVDDDDKENGYLTEEAEDIVEKLSDLKDVILPIEANSDWRLGLIKAWEKWEKEQVGIQLVAAYDDYLFRLQTNIPFEEDEDNYDNRMNEIMNLIKNEILDGRELNGEPRDFNY